MKKIINVILGIIMITIFSSFLSFLFGDSTTPSTKMATKISREIGDQFEIKYGLHYSGIYEEGPDGKYKRIGLQFHSNKILTKNQGRTLLINCLSNALSKFNSYPEFRLHMANSSFTNDNLSIVIFISPPKGVDMQNSDIAVFSLSNGVIGYRIHNPKKLPGYYFDEEETYEEALRIVESQNNK